jgi:ferredoxin
MSEAFTLHLEPLGRSLTVASGQSLLEAALAAGTCRECIARVLQGRVHHRIEWPGLSADEKAQGWVLPCVAVTESDVVLWQPRAGA